MVQHINEADRRSHFECATLTCIKIQEKGV